MMEKISERLAALRSRMAKEGIDFYLVPTADPHDSEFVDGHFACRAYLTGFTGSAGTALVGRNFAGVWTDGRYFLQAEAQLAGSGFSLYRMGEEGVPSLTLVLQREMTKGMVLGFDGRCVSAGKAGQLSGLLSKKGARVRSDLDLIGDIWTDRPPLRQERIFELPEPFSGESRKEKLSRLRRDLEEKDCEGICISCLDEIAWLLNLRGSDVSCNTVFYAYLLLTREDCLLFAKESAFESDLINRLRSDGVRIFPYEGIFDWLREQKEPLRIAADRRRLSASLWQALSEKMPARDMASPVEMYKAVKSPAEMEGMRRAHLRDGVARTRFLYWLKNKAVKEGATERSAAEKIRALRGEQAHYLGSSFEEIIAYKDHASIIHYAPDEQSDVPLKAEGMVLCDTGGQYLDGTTDVTRTVVLGEIRGEERRFFTLVLKGYLRLADAVFLEGSSGMTLDILAREALWREGVDYRHGTGHGVGCCLNVHEGPNRFHYRALPGGSISPAFAEGMVTSDEPGYYQDGSFGIRHESLLLCVKKEKNDYGQFFGFEILTLAPFDLDGIDPSLLDGREKECLNAYHRHVYETISPFLPAGEADWLRGATRSI